MKKHDTITSAGSVADFAVGYKSGATAEELNSAAWNNVYVHGAGGTVNVPCPSGTYTAIGGYVRNFNSQVVYCGGTQTVGP